MLVDREAIPVTLQSMKTNALVIGIALGIIFALVQVWSSHRLSDEVLLVAYAAVLVLVTATFVPSIKWGLASGLVAVVCEPVGQLFYYSTVYGTAIASGLLPYAFYVPRFVVLPLSGMLGGAIAEELQPKRKAAEKRGRRKESRRLGRTEVRTEAERAPDVR